MEELIVIVLIIALVVFAIWIYYTIVTAFLSMSDNIRDIDDKFGKLLDIVNNTKDE